MINKKPQFFLGIDGGGTKCRVRLENEKGDLLAQAQSSSANIATSVEIAQKSIVDATMLALKEANLPASVLPSINAYAGLAGANIENAKVAMSKWLHPFAQFNFSTDLHIACLGAHGSNNGAIIILGTGFCAGVIQNNQVTELGGHGLLLSDGASGSWIGLALFRHTLEVLDGLYPSTPLVEAFLAQTKFANAHLLTQRAMNEKPAYFARFAPLVFTMREDPIAKSIIQKAADYTTRYIEHLVRLGFKDITLVGGVADKISPCLSSNIQSYLCNAKYSPEQGAIQLAIHYAND